MHVGSANAWYTYLCGLSGGHLTSNEEALLRDYALLEQAYEQVRATHEAQRAMVDAFTIHATSVPRPPPDS